MAADRNADVDPRFDPVFQRGHDRGSAPDPSEEPAVEERLTRNPFRIALLAVSLVSILAGVLLLWHRVGDDTFDGGFSGLNQALLFRTQLIGALPIPLLAGGLLGVVLWLSIGALTHRDDPMTRPGPRSWYAGLIALFLALVISGVVAVWNGSGLLADVDAFYAAHPTGQGISAEQYRLWDGRARDAVKLQTVLAPTLFGSATATLSAGLAVLALRWERHRNRGRLALR